MTNPTLDNVTFVSVSRFAALVTGLFLPALETWRRWGSGTPWPAWADDYIAGVLLLYGWYAGRAEPSRSAPYLMAAWGYTFGIAYMSFFGHLQNLNAPDPSGFSIAWVIGFKGFGVVFSLLCLGLTWRSIASPTSGR